MADPGRGGDHRGKAGTCSSWMRNKVQFDLENLVWMARQDHREEDIHGAQL